MNVELDGPKVRAMREAGGANNAGELAERAGITPGTLRKVERNEGPVMVQTARKIAAALGVEPPQSLARPR